MFRRLNHVGIVVADIEAAKRFVSEVLGLELIREREVPQRRRSTAFFGAGEVEIELIEDRDPSSKARSLEGATARIEHIAMDVDDVREAAELLAKKGVRLSGDGIIRVGTRNNAWTDPETTGGVMYQLTAEAADE